MGNDVLIESLYAVGKVTLIPELVEVVREELSDDVNTVQCNYSADRLECAAEGAWRSMYEIEKERLFFSTSKGIWLTEEMKNSLSWSNDCIVVGIDDCEKKRDETVTTVKSGEELCYNSIAGSSHILCATLPVVQACMDALRDPVMNEAETQQDNTTVEENHKEQLFWMKPEDISKDMENTLDRMKELQQKYLM